MYDFQTTDEFRRFLKDAIVQIEQEIARIERYLSICSSCVRDSCRKRIKDLGHLKDVYQRILDEIL